MSKVCSKCLIDKDESEFKAGHTVCKVCRNKMDYKTYKERIANKGYRGERQKTRRSQYSKNPWRSRLCRSLFRFNGRRDHSSMPAETIKLLSVNRIISLNGLGMISKTEAKQFYNSLRAFANDREKLMSTVKLIFNIPKTNGGLNARS